MCYPLLHPFLSSYKFCLYFQKLTCIIWFHDLDWMTCPPTPTGSGSLSLGGYTMPDRVFWQWNNNNTNQTPCIHRVDTAHLTLVSPFTSSTVHKLERIRIHWHHSHQENTYSHKEMAKWITKMSNHYKLFLNINASSVKTCKLWCSIK